MTSLVLGCGQSIHHGSQQKLKEKQLHTSHSRVRHPTRHTEVPNHISIRPYRTRETDIVAKGWRRFHPRLLITRKYVSFGGKWLHVFFFLVEKILLPTRICFASSSPKRNRGAELRSQLQSAKEAMDKELIILLSHTKLFHLYFGWLLTTNPNKYTPRLPVVHWPRITAER